jgi:ubiquinone/menaquinone biosynthesis C-methylase UbiE
MLRHPATPSSGHGRLCPWWLAYTFDNPLRKLFHRIPNLLGDYVKAGMTVMDVGCGMGYFSIGMARLVGRAGKVIAVDLQQKMLDITIKRAQRAGVAGIISARRCQPNQIFVDEPIDFILAFWMVHEIAEPKEFFRQLRHILAPKGRILIAEPKMHVTAADFERTLQLAETAGLKCCEQPSIRLSLTALLAVSCN